MDQNFKKNTIWNTLGITLNSFNSLFFLIIVNRVNGISAAGVFSFAFSIACLLYVIGIYSGRTYQISDVNEFLNDKEYLVHKCLTCSLMFMFSVIFIFVQNYSVGKNIIIILLCVYKLFEAFSDTFYGYLQKHEELHFVGKSLFFKSIVGIIVFFVVDLITRNVIFSCIILNFNSLLFVAFYDIKKSLKYIDKSQIIRFDRVMKLFRIGFSVFAFSFLSVYIVNLQKYIIDFTLQDRFQTIFGIIVMPGTVMSLCGQYIISPLITNIISCYNEKRFYDLKKIVNKMTFILIVLGVFIEIVAYLLGIPVLNFVYGLNLSSYVLDLLLIIFGALCYAVAGIYSQVLITMRKNKLQLYIYILDVIFSLLVSYFLIVNLGIHGATYGYVCTMVFHLILYLLYYTYEYKRLLNNS